jgi:glycosyltransferase involved in cell wall biosynthesis
MTNKSFRILALNWRFIEHPQAGGAEINIFEQARRWVRQGHQVTLICADPGPKYAPLKNEIIDGISVRRTGNRLSVYLFALIYYLMHMRSFDYLVDVSNGIPFFTPLISRTPGVLVVHHVHGLQWFIEFPYPVAAIGWFLESRVVPFLYRKWPVIAVSPTTRDDLINLGFDSRNISIVYNGINCPAPIPITGSPINDDDKFSRIVYLGRLKRYKRIDRLVRMMPELRAQVLNIHLDIAGDGDARTEIVDLIHQLNLEECVTIHGYVSETRKAQILSTASVFATPSMHEGWGLSVIEANAYGCPAVAFDVPGLRMSIRNGDTGLLVLDDRSFLDALVRIITNPEFRNRLSTGASKWAAKFNWDVSAQQTLEVLQQWNLRLKPLIQTK